MSELPRQRFSSTSIYPNWDIRYPSSGYRGRRRLRRLVIAEFPRACEIGAARSPFYAARLRRIFTPGDREGERDDGGATTRAPTVSDATIVRELERDAE